MAFAGHFDGHFAEFFEDREQESMRYFFAGISDRARREREDAFGKRVGPMLAYAVKPPRTARATQPRCQPTSAHSLLSS